MHALSTCLLLVAAATLPAQQTTLSIVADGDVGALGIAAGQSAIEAVPSGTAIGGFPNTLNINGRIDLGSAGYASAVTIAYPTATFNGTAGINFFERAYARGTAAETSGTVAATTATGATFGPHALRLTFANAPGTTGSIKFVYRVGNYPTSTTSGSIDIGADGTIEGTAGSAYVTHEFAHTFDATGTVDVIVSNECRVTGTGNIADFAYAWTEIWVGFEPHLDAVCTITTYGQGCNGVTEAASEVILGNSRVINYLVSGAPANSFAISVFGSQQLALALPGAAGCSLLSNATVFQIVTTDGLGSGLDSLQIPATTTGTLYHQFLPLELIGGNLVLTASNGVKVDCVL